MLRQYSERLRPVLLAVDILICALVFFGGLLLIPGAVSYPPDLFHFPVPVIVLAVVACLAWPLALQQLSLYTSMRREDLTEVVSHLLLAGFATTLVLAATAFVVGAPVAPFFPVLCGFGQLVVLASLRLILYGGLRVLRGRGRNYRNIVIVGTGPRALGTKKIVEAHPQWGLRIVGFVDTDSSPLNPGIPAEKTRKLADIPALLREHVIDEVIVACPRAMLASLEDVVEVCSAAGIPLTLLSDLFGDFLPPPRPSHFDTLTALTFAQTHHSRTRLAVKRLIDLATASVVLLATAPLLGLAALLIRWTSPGPIFFRQIRCGLQGHPFTILKLRTMGADAEVRKHELAHLNEVEGPVFKMRDDPRVTRVGRWLRRLSIDELPQLWNVLMGEMSLVGPRPPVPEEVVQYETSQRRRLSMRPGLTCLWQVNGRSKLSFTEWVKLDLEYIDNWSLTNDLKILLKTIPAVISGRGAS
jgi:exopolysaccharide biosynthesis polyprenyl glycosylphosphotransferase